MGTHPIFESDFDCLTDHCLIMNRLAVGCMRGQTRLLSSSLAAAGPYKIRQKPEDVLCWTHPDGGFNMKSPPSSTSGCDNIPLQVRISTIKFGSFGILVQMIKLWMIITFMYCIPFVAATHHM